MKQLLTILTTISCMSWLLDFRYWQILKTTYHWHMLYVLNSNNYSITQAFFGLLFMVIYDNNSVPTCMWVKHKHLQLRQKCSLLQFILVFIVQLICTTFLHQKQLIFDMILYVVYLAANTTQCPISMKENNRIHIHLHVHTFLNIFGPPSDVLSSRIHLFNKALLKPIFPKGNFYGMIHTVQ